MRHLLLLSACYFIALGTSALAVEAVLLQDISISTRPGAPAPDGKVAYLRVSETDFAFLLFDFAAVLPEGTTADQMAKATLRLWTAGGRNGGACTARMVSGLWSERKGGIIAPGPPPVIAPSPVAVGVLNQQFLIIDVTSLVKEWLSGKQNWGMVIRGTTLAVVHDAGVPNVGLVSNNPISPMNLYFDSKENRLTGRLPTLQMVLRPGP